MNGVNILTQTAIKTPHPILIIITLAFGVIAVGLFWRYSNVKAHKGLAVASLSFAILYVITFLLIFVFMTPTLRYRYTANIDETVSLTEFCDKYTNIEYKDGVWMFEDRNVKSE